MSAAAGGFVDQGSAMTDALARIARAMPRGPLGAMLPELLRALQWQRSYRVLASAIGAPGRELDVADLAMLLRRLGFEATLHTVVPPRWEAGEDGALVCVSDDAPPVALVRSAGLTRRIAPADGSDVLPPRASHYLLVVDPQASRLRATDPLAPWAPMIGRIVRRAFLLSFLINLLGLTVPLFSSWIYDLVIGGNAPEVLPWFALGAALSLASMLALMRQRSRLLAAAHARLGLQVSVAVLDRLLRFPLLVGGKLRRSGIVSRVREVERVRDRLASANTIAVFDAPFIALSLFAVAFVGGWLVVVPVVYLGAFLLLGRWMSDYASAGNAALTPAIAEREALLADFAENAPALLRSGAAQGWSRRFLHVSATAVRGSFVQGTRLGASQAMAYSLGTGAALATLVVGLELVLAGAMTAGGLIASMLLIWRITSPAQTLFLALGRLRQIDGARLQLERFFATPHDGTEAGKQSRVYEEPPALVFDGVSFRYGTEPEPALAGVSFALASGETLAVVGPNGAGKTTLLRLAAGLMEARGGIVTLGGRNIAHFDPEDLRLVVAYFPENPAAFAATLADNLRAAAPAADEQALEAAMRQAWPGPLGDHFGNGLQTLLPLAQGLELADEDGQRLGLARVLLKPAPLLVIADPAENAAADAPAPTRQLIEQAKALLRARRGKSTIVIATQNPELIALADKALVLDRGRAVHFGPVPRPGADAGASSAGAAP
jgi:ABC-type bacteriocin/lantibiotic exporter with double-glycine peptidase domain